MREFVWIGLYAGLAALFILLADVVLRFFNIRHLLKQKAVFLELTPPTHTDKTPAATQELFAVLHGLDGTRSWADKFFSRKVTFSLEVVSARDKGIRYILRVPEGDATIYEQHIASYLPDVKLRRTEDYMSESLSKEKTRLLEFKQTGHFAYPLQHHEGFERNDPIAYLTGAMTKLASGEQMVFQVVLSPTQVPEADRLSRKILNNEELLTKLGRNRIPIVRILLGGISSLLFAVMDGVGDIAGGSSDRSYYVHHKESYRQQEIAKKVKPARTLSVFEQQLAESVHTKLSQPLFRANVRALVAVNSKQSEKQRVKGLRASLASFNVPKYQSLQSRRNFPRRLRSTYRLFHFKHRLPAFFSGNSCLFSTSEISSLYHFPHSSSAKTENVVKSLSRTLPAPISLKDGTKFDVVLGRNHHHGTDTAIGLTEKDRERHVYIIGGTGNGKTTMIQYGIVQDLQNGKGLAVIDPHGDLAETVLRHIPEERIGDVVYFNPDDLSYPIGLNLLELSPGLTGDDLLREKDLVTEATISVFRKIFSEDDSGGHRIEYVLRNAIQTALTLENPTLFTVYDLLNDADYRKEVLKNLQDKDLKNFWKNELGKAGEFQRVKMAAGITAKIGRFLFSASAKRVLEQPKSTIDFDDIINSGKILVCNFSKGLIGEDTSELFGVTVLAKLQMAALRRGRLKQAERKPFYLYVDEFQNFATPSFVQMLSEARKYKLFLIMAEQSTSQQDEQQLVNTILANVGTVICFRSANPADERMLLPMFKPFIQEGEIANLPSFNFYMRIAAIQAQEPFSGETIILDSDGSEDIAAQVRTTSRIKYAKKYVPPVEPKAIETPKGKQKPSDTKQKKKRQLRTGKKVNNH